MDVQVSVLSGTAGLRGLVGTGFNRMNNIVVQQTTQGFCRYLQQQAEQKLSARGVVIGKLVLHLTPKYTSTFRQSSSSITAPKQIVVLG